MRRTIERSHSTTSASSIVVSTTRKVLWRWWLWPFILKRESHRTIEINEDKCEMTRKCMFLFNLLLILIVSTTIVAVVVGMWRGSGAFVMLNAMWSETNEKKEGRITHGGPERSKRTTKNELMNKSER